MKLSLEVKMSKRKKIILLGIIFILAISIMTKLWTLGILFQPNLGVAPTWNGITPGKTSVTDAISVMGHPNSVEKLQPQKEESISQDTGMEYNIYHFDEYLDPESKQMVRVELLVNNPKNNSIVSAIYIDYPFKGLPLSPIVQEFGKPEYVTWFGCHERFLLWATQGLAVDANFIDVLAYLSRPWNKTRIENTLLFEPMGRFQFKSQYWPWPMYTIKESGCSENMSPNDLDPFDWNQILTPPVSSPTPQR